MVFYAVTCLCLALFAGATTGEKFRIVGGVSTTIQEFPFQVSLRMNGRHFCGGSIISQRHILTAGHCLFGSGTAEQTSMTVVTGSTNFDGANGTAYRVSRINVHPGYNGKRTQHRHDIAVVTLSSPITFDESTTKIELPSRDTQAGERVMISGWGLESAYSTNNPTILLKAATTVIGNRICSAILSQVVGSISISSDRICTFQRAGVGACKGDSGGPLSVNNQVVGVVSFGIPCARGYPDVFTRVYAYKSWIESIMASS